MTLGGIILCGGQSKRMASSKALPPHGDRTMLEHSVSTVARAAHPVVVVAARGQQLPAFNSSVEIAYDSIPDQGPLEGLRAGLTALGKRAELAFLAGCDYPFLRAEFITEMADALGDCECVVARHGDRLHPLAAVYRATVLDVVQETLKTGQRRMGDILHRCRCRVIEERELSRMPGGARNLINVNTPAEYEAAIRDQTEPT